jgi:hypothetical protein
MVICSGAAPSFTYKEKRKGEEENRDWRRGKRRRLGFCCGDGGE